MQIQDEMVLRKELLEEILLKQIESMNLPIFKKG